MGPGVSAEISNGLGDGPPFGLSVHLAGDVGADLAGVILHDVDLTAGRPADAGPVGAEHPEGRPAPGLSVDARAHLELAVFEFVQAARDEAGGGVINIFTAGGPASAAGDIAGIGFVFRTGFDDEQTIRTPGVFGLIPLQFLIAHEATLVTPIRGVGRTILVEFIVPDHFPIVRTASGETGQQQQRQG